MLIFGYLASVPTAEGNLSIMNVIQKDLRCTSYKINNIHNSEIYQQSFSNSHRLQKEGKKISLANTFIVEYNYLICYKSDSIFDI